MDSLEKIEKLGTDIFSLTLEEAHIFIDYLQNKLDICTATLAPTITVAVALGAGKAPLLWRRRRSSM
ncbi:hypothetical protein DVH24_036032 [Malus domestica]|uniref:Large ribosomal subunit protein bL12 oligomerization domain-containing protein n=1 Tax=Malus domestica TaxID=3750 RepID=A0A498JU69_MALDO|nr:hypothetical protein DVH24_036032 [Malus domestica]